jgi:hypothetical protein
MKEENFRVFEKIIMKTIFEKVRVDWMKLAQFRVECCAFLNTVIKFGHKIFWEFLDQLIEYKFYRKILLSVVDK